MPLCAKCHQNEARIHFTTVVDGRTEETSHFCTDCAPPTGLERLDPEKLEALSVTGKKCEFCGQTAFSGVLDPESPVYWCYDCGIEFSRILTDLCMAERPELLQRSANSSFLSICADPELQAWSTAASRKAVQILRDRRGQDDSQ